MSEATRDSYGKALAELGREKSDIVVLDCDLAGTTRTGVFKKEFPDRHFNCGIAESNMMSVAAGLAVSGLVPYVSTFAMFAAGRAYEQVRNSIAHCGLNVKICATHAGISVGEDGATHQCNEDIALMRSVPDMLVCCPADADETRAAVRAAYAHSGPVYIRLSRFAVPLLSDGGCDEAAIAAPFEFGKAKLLHGGDDVTVITCGIVTGAALAAAARLAARGINVRVVDMHTIKPLDVAIVEAAARETGRILTVEEHSIVGGLGDAVAAVVAELGVGRIRKLGTPDVFTESGSAEELLAHYGLDADGVERALLDFVK